MIKHLATENFQISKHRPIVEGGPSEICLGENNRRGGNNTIYFKRDQIKELIALLRLADQEFGE